MDTGSKKYTDISKVCVEIATKRRKIRINKQIEVDVLIETGI